MPVRTFFVMGIEKFNNNSYFEHHVFDNRTFLELIQWKHADNHITSWKPCRKERVKYTGRCKCYLGELVSFFHSCSVLSLLGGSSITHHRSRNPVPLVSSFCTFYVLIGDFSFHQSLCQVFVEKSRMCECKSSFSKTCGRDYASYMTLSVFSSCWRACFDFDLTQLRTKTT